ncbi:unnamed protein product [marine sediment metagenome]|uniref:ArnR1-like winged helix-turn-helix domain-containing protein n=1 Tax=marine sediment metagenome TaxID=412755 RepID=X1IFU9_9ZZZZ
MDEEEAGLCLPMCDKIVELLYNSRWHSVDELKAKIPLPPGKLAQLAPVLDFLAEFYFIEFRGEGEGEKEKSEVKITQLGLSFLELPLDDMMLLETRGNKKD